MRARDSQDQGMHAFYFLFFTAADAGAPDLDVPGVLEMDAVRVGAVPGGRDGDVLHLDASGAVELEVALWAVADPDVAHGDIEAAVKPYKLENKDTQRLSFDPDHGACKMQRRLFIP